MPPVSSAFALMAASEHAEAALALARGLRARRFEAEGLALRAEVRLARGDFQRRRVTRRPPQQSASRRAPRS